MTLICKPVEYVIKQENSPDFDEQNTFVKILDEGGGEFLSIMQDTENAGQQTLRLDYAELKEILTIAESMKSCGSI